MKLIATSLVFTLLFFSVLAHAQDDVELPKTELTVITHDKTELTFHQYPAQGDYLIVWVGSGYGFNERTTQTAMEFARRGIEVWQINFAEALFQTATTNFIRDLDARYVADIIDAAHARTHKKVVLFGRAYSAIPVLRGATYWQQRPKHEGKLVGALLFSPDLFASIPALGKDPEYLPITRLTDVPMLILQGGRRGTSWQLPRLIKELQSHNPAVYFSVMPGVAGVFYEGDQNPETLAKLRSLPDELMGYIKLLDATPYIVTTRDYQQPAQPSQARMDFQLKPFKGKPTPHPVTLNDISGDNYKRENFEGKVTVVNFWATWCPPCVEEIPSLNRLREIMRDKPFELVSINYAETPEHVNAFMQRVSVKFPVLMDLDGKVSQQWNVIAYPSTFVIGKDGRIHYGVNAAIAWDSPEVIDTMNRLLK